MPVNTDISEFYVDNKEHLRFDITLVLFLYFTSLKVSYLII